MAIERTLSIVKPDAVRANHIGGVLAKLEAAGLTIIGAKLMKLSQEQAGAFYGVHRERPFFQELVDFMTSGPIMVQVLEGDNAILVTRTFRASTPASSALNRRIVRPSTAAHTSRTSVMAISEMTNAPRREEGPMGSRPKDA